MLNNKTKSQLLAKKVQEMKTAKQRNRGMLIFNQAPANFCAVFKLPLGGFFPLVHCVGMKFPIDILFCDRNHQVIFKKLNVLPGSVVMPWKYALGGACYLLEFSDCDLSSVELEDELSWRFEDAA